MEGLLLQDQDIFTMAPILHEVTLFTCPLTTGNILLFVFVKILFVFNLFFRLGALGFLALPELLANSTTNSTGFYGKHI